MANFDTEWFLKRIKEVRPNDYKEYEFLGEYTGSLKPIKAKHKVCGEYIEMLPNSFISRGSGCPLCARAKVNAKTKKTPEEVQSKLPEGVTLISDYTGIHKKIRIHCEVCDSEYDIIANDIIRRGNCTHCNKYFKRTYPEVKNEVSEATNGEYQLVSKEYKNANTKLEVQHNVCGSIYGVTMHNFRRGRRCPVCRTSIGETETKNALEDLGITYERQKKYADLKNISNLSYDFYLPKENVLIEYQGEQHYKPVKHFGGKEVFEYQLKMDTIKKQYAEENGINILYIKYTLRTKEEIKEFLIKNLDLPDIYIN